MLDGQKYVFMDWYNAFKSFLKGIGWNMYLFVFSVPI